MGFGQREGGNPPAWAESLVAIFRAQEKEQQGSDEESDDAKDQKDKELH